MSDFTYKSPDFRLVDMFLVRPNEAITRIARAQVLERLPFEDQGAIRGSLDELPLHRLQIAHNLWCFQQIADNGVNGGVARDRVAILGYEVEMRKLLQSVSPSRSNSYCSRLTNCAGTPAAGSFMIGFMLKAKVKRDEKRIGGGARLSMRRDRSWRRKKITLDISVASTHSYLNHLSVYSVCINQRKRCYQRSHRPGQSHTVPRVGSPMSLCHTVTVRM